MSKINPAQNRLKRRIKTINKEIIEKEEKLADLTKKYKNCIGRPKKDDKQRKNDIERMKKLNSKISQLKAEKRNTKIILKKIKNMLKKYPNY